VVLATSASIFFRCSRPWPAWSTAPGASTGERAGRERTPDPLGLV